MPDFSQMDEAFVSNTQISDAVAKGVRAGKLRKLASRVYTRNLTDPPADVVQRNLWPLVGSLLPGALIADRTALENRPAKDGSVFVIADHKREISLPGITVRPRKGPPPLPSDRPFVGGLRIASRARAFLENMRPSRPSKGRLARTLPLSDLETRLETELRTGGEAALQRIRDEAREIAKDLGLTDEFSRLDRLIGALLGSRDDALTAPTAIARASGFPYDPDRVALFQILHAHLANTPASVRPRQSAGVALPFFEAYFSNFIEGTEFEVDDAENIVFRGYIPPERPADAHDIIGTWKIVSDEREMSRTPGTFEELNAILLHRHARIMEGRPEKGPGHFKTRPNRAGSTHFVAPDLVNGTLLKGFEVYRSLAAAMDRAAFMMFLIAEVHPFADGNGRVARIMMNAELVAASEARIIVPTVYRNNYLNALRVLSHNKAPQALVAVLDFAQRYTAAIDFGSLERARFELTRTNAFVPPNEADEAGKRLMMPTPALLAS